MTVLRTRLESYLENKTVQLFDYEDYKYMKQKINDELTLVLVAKTLFDSEYASLGIYSSFKHGFIYTNNAGMLRNRGGIINLDAIADISKNKLEGEYKTLIQKEILDYTSFQKAKRGIKNDLNDDNYLNLVNTKAKEYCLSGTKPEIKLSISTIDNFKLTEFNIIDFLKDEYDAAYNIAEDIISKSNYDYEILLRDDILEKMDEIMNNPKSEITILSHIKAIVNDNKYKSFTVEVTSHNGIKDTTIRMTDEQLGRVPYYFIKKISWKKRELFNIDNYKVDTMALISDKDFIISEALNFRGFGYYSEFKFEDFINVELFDDEDFLDKAFDKNYRRIHKISERLLNDKSFILRSISKVNGTTDLYTRLSDNLKEDKDITLEFIKNNPSIIRWLKSEKLFEDKDVIETILEKSDDSLISEIHNKIALDLKDSTQYDLYMKLLKKMTTRRYYYGDAERIPSNYIPHIKDLDVIEHLLNISAFKKDQIILLPDIVFSNDSFKSNFLCCSIVLDSKDFDSIYNKFLKNGVTFTTDENVMLFLRFNAVLNSKLAKDIFDKDCDKFQIKFCSKSSSYINYMTYDNQLKICMRDVYNYNHIEQNVRYSLKFIEDCLINNICIFRHFRHDDYGRFNGDYLGLAKILNKYPNILDSQKIIFSYWNEKAKFDIAKELVKKQSIIPYFAKYRWGRSKHVLDDKDIVLNSLKHDFSHFKLIQPASKRYNFTSLLDDKDFLIGAIGVASTTNDLVTMIQHLYDKKILIFDNDLSIAKEILLKDFSVLDWFKRTVYNNKDLIIDVIKSMSDKSNVLETLEKAGSKLRKDKDVLALL